MIYPEGMPFEERLRIMADDALAWLRDAIASDVAEGRITGALKEAAELRMLPPIDAEIARRKGT